MAKQSRSAPVMQAVIDAVIERLLVSDETLIRIPEICAATGVNYGSVYHHFGSREGVIDAAYVSIFTTLVEEDIALLREIFAVTETFEEYVGAVQPVLMRYSSKEERVARLTLRVRILAACATRPHVRDAISMAQARLTEELLRVVEQGQERGWLRRDLSARAIAVFLESVLFGRVQDDVSMLPVSDEEWERVVTTVLLDLVESV